MVRKNYKEEGAHNGPDQPVDFEKDVIRLDLPMKETKINDTWTIVPLTEPIVSYTSINFKNNMLKIEK